MVPTSVAIVGVEAQLHAEGAGQIAFVQAVDHVQAVIGALSWLRPSSLASSSESGFCSSAASFAWLSA